MISFQIFSSFSFIKRTQTYKTNTISIQVPKLLKYSHEIHCSLFRQFPIRDQKIPILQRAFPIIYVKPKNPLSKIIITIPFYNPQFCAIKIGQNRNWKQNYLPTQSLRISSVLSHFLTNLPGSTSSVLHCDLTTFLVERRSPSDLGLGFPTSRNSPVGKISEPPSSGSFLHTQPIFVFDDSVLCTIHKPSRNPDVCVCIYI